MPLGVLKVYYITFTSLMFYNCKDWKNIIRNYLEQGFFKVEARKFHFPKYTTLLNELCKLND